MIAEPPASLPCANTSERFWSSVSVSINAAKSARATEKLFPSESVMTKFVFVPSIPNEETVVFVSVMASLRLLKSTFTLPPFSRLNVKILDTPSKLNPVNCWSSADVNSQEFPSQK